MKFRLYRVGGLWHWRVGRLGGSIYIAKAEAENRIMPLFRNHRAEAARYWQTGRCVNNAGRVTLSSIVFK